MFSGGDYDEVARWLRNFLTSHAKREDARSEVRLYAADDREGKSYGARFELGDRVTPIVEFDYEEVAAQRGSLAWCQKTADAARAEVRRLVWTGDGAGGGRRRE